jgi:hypothetical protein
MKRMMRGILAAALALAASAAWGTYHLFVIEEIFSNADGTIQYLVLKECCGADGQNMLGGRALTATQGAITNTYHFAGDLPGGGCDYYGCMLAMTAHQHVLIATQGFAALNLVDPDYTVPNGFIPLPNGSLITINYAGADQVSFTTLPTDGVSAMTRAGVTVPSMPTNFAGTSASVNVAAPNYDGLWWAAPAGSESGWGINFAHQGDTIFASWFTYDLTGKGMWLVMTAPKSAPNTYGGKLLRTTGPAFNATPFIPSQVAVTEVGSATLTFSGANSATFDYTVNGVHQIKPLTHQAFGTLPTCATATGSLAAATNYQDLWWASPAGSESGWGINLTHEGDTIFASWFTYDLDNSQMWLVVTAPKTAPGVYSGTLLRTTGPAFNAVPFDTAKVLNTAVGNATFTVVDGNNISFSYTVNGSPQQVKTITRQVFAGPGTVCH